MLPEMDGLAVCKAIKSDPDLRQTKVILITARTDEQSKLTALSYGADDFLQKPFSMCPNYCPLGLTISCKPPRWSRIFAPVIPNWRRSSPGSEETRQQLVQSEKMNAVGRLSGGILHEINNPLNAAIMALHPGQTEKLQRNGGQKPLNELDIRPEAYIHRHDGFTQLLPPNSDAARGKIYDRKSALSAAERMLAQLIWAIFSIKHENILNSPVRGSKNQITHVLINLLSNAATAVRAVSPNPHHCRAYTCRSDVDLLLQYTITV